MELKLQLAIAIVHLVDRIFGTTVSARILGVFRLEFSPEQNDILEADYDILRGISQRSRERAAGGTPEVPPPLPPPGSSGTP